MQYWTQILYAFKNRPLSIVLITGFNLLMAVLCLLVSFYYYYFEESLIKTSFKEYKMLLYSIEVVFFLLGLSFYTLAIALWKFQNWARMSLYWLNIFLLPSTIVNTICFLFFYNAPEKISYATISIIYLFFILLSIRQLKKDTIKSYFSQLSKNLYNKNKKRNRNFIELSNND